VKHSTIFSVYMWCRYLVEPRYSEWPLLSFRPVTRGVGRSGLRTPCPPAKGAKDPLSFTGERSIRACNKIIIVLYRSVFMSLLQAIRIEIQLLDSLGKSKNCYRQRSDFKAKMHQIRLRLGSVSDPSGGAFSAHLDPIAGF